jgi:polysaccharide transporter, PST family
LSRLNHDPVRFRRYLASSLGMVAFAGMAVGADLTLAGKDVVRVLLGPNWSESGRIFELFGPGIGVMLLYSTVGWIHLSIGKPGRWLRWTLVESSVTALMFILALHWGVRGIAVAWSVSYWTLLIPGFWYAGRPIEFGVASFLAAVWRYAAAALAAGFASAAIIRHSTFWGTAKDADAALVAVIVITILFVALYLGTVILFHWGLAPLRQLSSLLRELAPLRKTAKPTPEAV